MASIYPKDSYSSTSSTLFPGWSEHLLRKKYRDPMKLKDVLDGIYGPEQYGVIVKGDRWILALPRPLTDKEIEDLEERIRTHY